MKTMHINTTSRLSIIAAAVIAAFSTGAIADEAMAPYIDPDSSVSVGLGHWSKDRPQTGMYGGQDQSDLYGLLDLDLIKLDRQTGTWLGLQARDVGVDPSVRFEYLRQGNFGFSALFNRITRDDPNRVFSNLLGFGTTTQVINNNTTVGGREIDFRLRRDVSKLGYYQNLTDTLDFRISFQNDAKNGNRFGSRGSEALFIAEPIDSTIRTVETILNYTQAKFQLSGGYNGSWYQTENTLTTAFRAGTPIYLSQPLNNQAHQLFVNGGYQITPGTRATFKLEYAVATQDERIPTADIAGLAAPTAPKNLSGEVETTLVQLGVTARPLPQLSLLANLRHHDVNDKTPPVRVVAAGAGTDVAPYSYTTDSGKLEGTYRLAQGFNIVAGLDIKQQDRPIPIANNLATSQRKVPHRAQIDENTYRLQLNRSLSDTINGSVGYSYSDRDGDALSLTDAAIQDLINPIHIADRKREKVRLSLDWMPLEKLNVQLTADSSSDKYGSSATRPYGVRDGRGNSGTLDVSYQINDNWSFNGWVSKDKSEAIQYNSTLGTLDAVKTATLTDEGDAVGLGLNGALSAAVRFGSKLQLSRTRSGFFEVRPATPALPANSTAPLPDVDSTLTRISVFSEVALNKSSDLRFDVIHERWKSNDWQWQFANGSSYVYGTTTDGTLIVATPSYSTSFVGARYIYKFQ
jgi:MtrB/PioB family decaheme-associated outer membrane protein